MGSTVPSSDPAQLEALRKELLDLLEASPLMALMDTRHGLRTPATTPKSIATVDRVVASALEVLTERNIREITTRDIAEHAGLNIATLYRYFSDLNSILMLASVQWQLAFQYGLIEHILNGVMSQSDADPWLDESVDMSVAARLAVPGALELLGASKAIPEISQVEHAAQDTASELLAAGLAVRYPTRTAAEWFDISKTMLTMMHLAVDDACLRDPVEAVRIEHIKLVLNRFVTPYIEE